MEPHSISQVAATLNELAAAVTVVHEEKNYRHAIVPNGFKLENISQATERAQDAPYRKTGTLKLKSIESLLNYTAAQKESNGSDATGIIYADPDSRTITAVLNDNKGSTPGWRDHRAEFKAEFTPEFANWFKTNSTPMGQTEFAEFIEDNIVDIAGEYGTTLLEIATTIQATTGINFSSAKRLQNGQVQMQYTENIDTRAGASGSLEIPKEFTLGLRIFKNGAGYKIKARLKYRLASGAVKFWYELDRPERSIEDAFNDYVKTVTEQSGYTVLLGAA